MYWLKTMAQVTRQTSALEHLNISFAWHGSLAGQVAFSVAVLHLLLQERPMLMFLLP